MKLLFDLFPVILFFVTYTLFPRFGPKEEAIFYATAVTIAATFAQIGWVWMKHRKVDTMLWVSLVVIVVFGGATLLLRDETFIKWKPTVLYWLFAAILAVARLGFGKNLIQTLMKEQIELPEPGWARMLWSWVGFFAFMGVANLYVAFNYSTDTWVNFKMFGTLGLMLVFVLGQGFMLSRYMEHEKEEGK